MKKKNFRYKSWKKRRDERKFRYELERRRNQQRKKYAKAIYKESKSEQSTNFKHPKKETFVVPKEFSIVENHDEVIGFFNGIIEYNSFSKSGVIFFIDMSNVIKITVDALMYLLSIIQNQKFTQKMLLSIEGNLPRDEEARSIVKKCGFLRQLKSSNSETQYRGENIWIESGRKIESDIVKKVCEFIEPSIKTMKLKRVYNVLGEIMSNAHQHAYISNGSNYAQEWLIYVEKKASKFVVLFLDTGVGIAKSIAQKFPFERHIVDHSSLVVNAFKSGKRTKTKEGHRGKGLPRIRNSVYDKTIDKVCAMSNKACYTITKDKEENKELSSDFQGTLYYIELKIEEEIINEY